MAQDQPRTRPDYRWSDLQGFAAFLRPMVLGCTLGILALAVWAIAAWGSKSPGLIALLAGFRDSPWLGAFLLLLCATGLLYLVWIYRATANLWLLRPQEQLISAGWAVGGHLLPLANLVLPWLAMKQLVWPFNGRCGWWWICSLAGLFASGLAERLGDRAKIEGAVIATIVGWLAYALAGWLLFRLIGAVARWQAAERRQTTLPP